MAKLVWDQTGEKLYEAGVSNLVLYKFVDNAYKNGVAWNGVTSISESPSGAEESAQYADNKKYLSLFSKEEYGATLEAFMSPEEFDECDGSAEIAPGVSIKQQNRKMFGLAYKTIIGNDTDEDDHGYKIHLVYGCKASPSEKTHETINESRDLSPLSWTITTTPVDVTGHKPTSVVEIDSTKVDADKLKAFEDIIFGTDDAEARMPLPDEVAELLKEEPVGP